MRRERKHFGAAVAHGCDASLVAQRRRYRAAQPRVKHRTPAVTLRGDAAANVHDACAESCAPRCFGCPRAQPRKSPAHADSGIYVRRSKCRHHRDLHAYAMGGQRSVMSPTRAGLVARRTGRASC